MQVIDLPDTNAAAAALAFSPDVRLLAARVGARVFVLDTVAGTARELWREPTGGHPHYSGVGFTADGHGLIVHSARLAEHSLAVHDVETGAVVRELAINRFEKCEVGPRGTHVLIAAKPQPGRSVVEFVRWNPLTGEKEPAFGRHAYNVGLLAVSADEKWVAGTTKNDVRVWNFGGKKLPTRAHRQFNLGRFTYSHSLALSGDGGYLAVGTRRGQNRAVRVIANGTGEEWAAPGAESVAHHDLAFHPARPLLASAVGPGEVAFFDAGARAEVQRFAWGVGKLGALAFSADGLRCAVASVGKVVVWDLDT